MAERQRIDAFELLEKTPERPLDYKGISQSQRDFKPKYSMKGLMLKLNLQYLAT